jgi:hypothetical protein
MTTPPPLEWRVHELEQTLEQLQDQLEVLARAVLGDDGDAGGQDREMPWTVWGSDPEQLAGAAYDAIGEWVCWLARTYSSDTPGRCLPTCWPQHPGLVAELLTLHHTWRSAFLSARNADAAQAWHNNHLPGFLARVDAYLTRDCLAGQHRAQLPAPAVCSEQVSVGLPRPASSSMSLTVSAPLCASTIPTDGAATGPAGFTNYFS